MNLNPELRAPRKKTLWILLIAIVALGGLGYVAFDLVYGPTKPWYARWQIKRYLKKQTGRTDFKTDFKFALAADVSALQDKLKRTESDYLSAQTNLTRLHKEIAALSKVVNAQVEVARRTSILTKRQQGWSETLTNIPAALTNYALAVLTNVNSMEKEIAGLAAVVDPVNGPLLPQHAEIAATIKQRDEKSEAVSGKRREMNVLLRQLSDGKRADNGTNQVDLTETDRQSISNKIGELRQAMTALRAEETELNKLVSAKQNDVDEKLKGVAVEARRLRFLTNRVAAVKILSSSVVSAKDDLAQAEKDVAARLKEYHLPAMALDERRKILSDKSKELAETRKNYDRFQKEVTDLRKDFNAQKAQLDALQSEFSAEYKKKYDQANTYSQMYTLLGQQLWAASQMLASPDPQQQRIGLAVASQAVNFCSGYIENLWLAARICEGYILCNFQLADDPRRKTATSPDTIIQQCTTSFRDADETNNILFAYKIALESAAGSRGADYLRYLLGREYENQGKYSKALSIYRAIEDKQNFRFATQRIAWIEERLKEK